MYIVTDNGEGCTLQSFSEEKYFKDASKVLEPNQITLVEIPTSSPDCWSIEGGNIIEDTELFDRRKAIENLKHQRDLALLGVVVDINGVDIWANPTEEQNILGRIRLMEDEGGNVCKWIQGDNIYTLTLDDLKTVYSEGTKTCSKIYDDYITAVEALDGTL